MSTRMQTLIEKMGGVVRVGAKPFALLSREIMSKFLDIDIFKNSIEDLKAIDSEFIEGKKYILFKNLGICIGGMTGEKIPEGKLLIAFDKNHFDFFEYFIEV